METDGGLYESRRAAGEFRRSPRTGRRWLSRGSEANVSVQPGIGAGPATTVGVMERNPCQYAFPEPCIPPMKVHVLLVYVNEIVGKNDRILPPGLPAEVDHLVHFGQPVFWPEKCGIARCVLWKKALVMVKNSSLMIFQITLKTRCRLNLFRTRPRGRNKPPGRGSNSRRTIS